MFVVKTKINEKEAWDGPFKNQPIPTTYQNDFDPIFRSFFFSQSIESRSF